MLIQKSSQTHHNELARGSWGREGKVLYHLLPQVLTDEKTTADNALPIEDSNNAQCYCLFGYYTMAT